MITRAVLFERFVGRDAELQFLRDAHGRCASSVQGVAVTISGEPGSGKSRLVSEFVRGAGPSRAIVRVGCDSIGTSAYAPFVDALRELSTRREVLGLESIVRARASLEQADAVAGSADESRAKRHLLLGRALHDCAARLGSLTLILEDAHWCDTSSLEAFASLVSSSRRAPLFVIVTYRSDDLAGDPSRAMAVTKLERAGADRVVLGPLRDSDLLASLRDAVPDQALATLRAVCDLADGKPLVAEELARNLVERGPSSGVEAPRSLRAAVIERVARLGDADRAVIERAAVFGRAMRLADADVLGSPAIDVRRAMAAACELQLIVETELDGEPAFRFRHALTREILYRETLQFERHFLHRAIAEALETRDPAARPTDVAYHWWAAKEAGPALAWNERAADTALGVAALADAAVLFGRAWAFANGDPSAVARIGLKYATTLCTLGRLELCIELCIEAARTLVAAHRQDDALRLRLIGARAHFDGYRLIEADAELDAIRHDLSATTAADIVLDLEIATCSIRTSQARLTEALESIERARPIAAALGAGANVRVLTNEATIYLRLRDLERAEHLLRASIELATSMADARARSSSLLNLGGIAYYRGSPAAVIACAEEALAFAKHTGAELAAGRARSIIAYTNAELGNFSRTRALLDEATRDGDTSFPTWSAAELFLARATGERAERLGDLVARAEAALPDNYLLKNALRHAPWMLPAPEATALVNRLVQRLEDGEIGDLVALTVAAYGDETQIARAKKTFATTPRLNAFDRARERIVIAQLEARNDDPDAARAAALEALPFFHENGFWLLESHAATLAGNTAEAHAILHRVGATAELSRARAAHATAPQKSPEAHTRFDATSPPATDAPATQTLSRRELQIAYLIAAGHSNRDIAERLAIAPRTVETHTANIYEKLNVHSRTEVAKRIAKT